MCDVKNCRYVSSYEENDYSYCELHWGELNDGIPLTLKDGVIVETMRCYNDY